ncbi:hypothetical protein JTB14_027211 [Gonioctena quinquepunctata]|nr:hypothetical protein JTB14_027211 [Gonioctena quinquepunctata]
MGEVIYEKFHHHSANYPQIAPVIQHCAPLKSESDNSDSDPDEDFLANDDLVETAIVVFSESEGEDRDGEDRQVEADDDAGQNINGSNSAHDSDCSEDDIPLSLVRWSKRSFTPDMITFTEDLVPKNVAGKSTPT